MGNLVKLRQTFPNKSNVDRWVQTEPVREEIAKVRFYKECFIRFCDKTEVKRAQKRIQKKTNTIDAFTQSQTSAPVIHKIWRAHVRISQRTLLSGDKNIVRRNKHVLLCNLCKSR